MPRLVVKLGPWKSKWNVASDDFFLPALVAVVVRLVCVGLLVGVLLFLYVPEDEEVCDVETQVVPPFIYGSLFALVFLETVIMINEAVIFSITARGALNNLKSRSHLPYFLLSRVVLYVLEVVVICLCTAALYSPAILNQLTCRDLQANALRFARGVIITLWVVEFIYFVGFMFYLDPAGLCTSSLLDEMNPLNDFDNFDETDGDGNVYSSRIHDIESGKKRKRAADHFKLYRKFAALCCCAGTSANQSRSLALQELSRALHTIFSDIDMVFTDVLAGMILLNKSQKALRQQGECLFSDFRQFTFDNCMPKLHIPDDYKHPKCQKMDFSEVDERILFEDLTYYMHYCMGIYGWPLHVFDNLLCGMCQLCCASKLRCFHHRHEDFVEDNCCLCGVGSLKLRTRSQEDHILYVNYKNDVFEAPFSICLDEEHKSIVLTVRGTLSIKDVLTDLSVYMMKIHIPGCPVKETYVHKGMYITAMNIKKKLLRDRKDGQTIMQKIFRQYPHYRLVITGHSLGAGVASLLAVILKPKLPDLVCYAFSPPGCIFSFPLALYSREFITSVVVGNDMVARVTFRSLLYLKSQIVHLLEQCKRPKHEVILEPRALRRLKHLCCHKGDGKGFEDQVVRLKDVEESVKPQKLDMASVVIAKKAAGIWKAKIKEHSKKKSCHSFASNINIGERTAAFPPGRIIHIETEVKAKPWCLGLCFPAKMKVSRVAGEDLSVIILDRGIVEDHLPNVVLAAMKRCQKQLIDRKFERKETQKRRARIIKDFVPPERVLESLSTAARWDSQDAELQTPDTALSDDISTYPTQTLAPTTLAPLVESALETTELEDLSAADVNGALLDQDPTRALHMFPSAVTNGSSFHHNSPHATDTPSPPSAHTITVEVEIEPSTSEM